MRREVRTRSGTVRAGTSAGGARWNERKLIVLLVQSPRGQRELEERARGRDRESKEDAKLITLIPSQLAGRLLLG